MALCGCTDAAPSDESATCQVPFKNTRVSGASAGSLNQGRGVADVHLQALIRVGVGPLTFSQQLQHN